MTEGQQVRDFVPVKDVATSFIDELTRNDQEPGKLKLRNIGTGAPQHLCDFAQYWWKYWSASGKLFIGKESYRPNEVMRYIPEV
jgi:nucleoside-diphosphate-sugar epimerase